MPLFHCQKFHFKLCIFLCISIGLAVCQNATIVLLRGGTEANARTLIINNYTFITVQGSECMQESLQLTDKMDQCLLVSDTNKAFNITLTKIVSGVSSRLREKSTCLVHLLTK